ncbi:ABC transporter ATP-binding protein [Pokkaliibacter sp. CJK22405]|uniref:ABC transporter ATP-binding protein n=1 Tax=Pokkaliibacter sp. CJK22405 TaxID=3384615 RepID=UPI003984A7D4
MTLVSTVSSSPVASAEAASGHEHASHYSRSLHATPARATLEARQLRVKQGDQLVIPELDLQLASGKVSAIVGPNGCGKSTLLNTLARVLSPEKGQVILEGKALAKFKVREIARRMALLPQETTAPEGMSIEDLVRFGRQPHQSWLQQWSEEDALAVQEAIAAASLTGMEQRLLEELSGGQRQRAWIAMAIAQQTPLLLLDEPTSALDLGHQIEVFELIRHLAEQGKTVAMVVHDLQSACRYADELIAMKAGRIIAQGSPAQVLTPALVRELYEVECQIIHDPHSGAPLIVNARRCGAEG